MEHKYTLRDLHINEFVNDIYIRWIIIQLWTHRIYDLIRKLKRKFLLIEK